jgi:beta-glucosidase
MDNRTYRYFRGDPLYPFGYGLSYTRFGYSDLNVEPVEPVVGQKIIISVNVKNVGEAAGDEVVQLYVRDMDAYLPVAKHSLVGFKKIHLAPGEIKKVDFIVLPKQLSFFDDAVHKWVQEPGLSTFYIGGCQPGLDHRRDLDTATIVSSTVAVK